MKTAPKITFSPDQIGFASVVRVLYKDVYVGRIVFNDMGLMEYHENGSAVLRNCIAYKEFNDQDKIKAYVIKRILERDRARKRAVLDTIKSLPVMGMAFMKKFLSNHIINRKDLQGEHKRVADIFVVEGLLERGKIDNRVVYFIKTPMVKLLQEHL